MVTFAYSETTSTFKFSAKTDVITLPASIQKMAPEDMETLKQFCMDVRELYVRKIVQFSIDHVGEKLCPIQLRHDSIRETVALYRERMTPEVFNPLYAQFHSVSQQSNPKKNLVMGKPRVRTSTALDHIEEDLL